ncbi:hypothetical protein ACI5KX_12720 [Erythrobacter sp. GH1-10]|uniref:hypothetical protein n=1 Tax=Erythrobacter sp. GH1-10 TaxID=3349334 RepID=UPI003877D42F
MKNPFERFNGNRQVDTAPPEGAPLGGTRGEAVQRLQIGLSGIAAMVLLVGLASIIGSQANLTEQSAVPDAAPTTEPTAAPQQRDPLADAGVVPDIPAEPSPTPTTGTVQAQPTGAATPPADATPQP